jgi:hypothetical protein
LAASAGLTGSGGVKSASGAAADILYRPQALSVPIMTPRDGPIAAINSDATELPDQSAVEQAIAQAITDAPAVQVVADPAPDVEILAVRPAWVRVSAADGTVLFEKVLDAGERYSVPPLAQAPVLRAGNSASVYFAVNGKTYGPASPGSQVVKNLSLAVEDLTQTFQVADVSGDADLARFVAVAAASQITAPDEPTAPAP